MADYSEDFLAWYRVYPRKKAKGDAYKAWKQTEGDRPPLEELIATTETAAAQPRWQDKEYVPYPATWLRSHGWEDEIEDGREAWQKIDERQKSLAPWWETIRPRLERMAWMECYDEKAREALSELAGKIEEMGPEEYYPALDEIERGMLKRAWSAMEPGDREEIEERVDAALDRAFRGTEEQRTWSRRAMIKSATRFARDLPSVNLLSMGLDRWA